VLQKCQMRGLVLDVLPKSQQCSDRLLLPRRLGLLCANGSKGHRDSCRRGVRNSRSLDQFSSRSGIRSDCVESISRARTNIYSHPDLLDDGSMCQLDPITTSVKSERHCMCHE
jgi:hypothetical protein